MEKILGVLPASIIGWAAIVIAVTISIIYLISKVRSNDMKILRDTNKDQGDRIKLLEESVKRLDGQVQDLLHQNKTLNDLVVVALKQYFFENPKIAENMKDKVL